MSHALGIFSAGTWGNAVPALPAPNVCNSKGFRGSINASCWGIYCCWWGEGYFCGAGENLLLLRRSIYASGDLLLLEVGHMLLGRI